MERGDRGDREQADVAAIDYARATVDRLGVESPPQAMVGRVTPVSGDQPPGRVTPPLAAAGGNPDVRVIVRHSENVNDLFAALAAAQCAEGYGDIEKSRLARVESKREGARSYAYTYETLKDVLDATRPFLGAQGIAVMQFPFPGRDTVTIRTLLGHKSGQWIYNDLTAMTMGMDPQQVGSGITYLRRYALKSITGVAADDDDDDGSAAQPKQAPPQAAQRASQQQAPQQQAPPPPAAPPPQAGIAKSLAPVGRISKLEPKDDGKAMVALLDTGFQSATRDADVIKALRTYADMGATVRFETEPSADPQRYAPRLVNVVPVPAKRKE